MSQGRTKRYACANCRALCARSASSVNRAHREGRKLYCGHDCASAGRRSTHLIPVAIRKRAKRLYDREYRSKHAARIKAAKAAHYQATRDPEKERQHRRERMSYHVEYCRRYYSDPVRKAAKVAYDEERRALEQMHGDPAWAECLRLYWSLRREILARSPNRYERAKARGFVFNKSKQRRRDAGCPRAMT